MRRAAPGLLVPGLLSPGSSRFRRWLPSVGLAGCVGLLMCLQSTVAKDPAFRVDLTILVVVFLALEHELLPGLVHAVAFGYLADLFSGEPVGLMAFTAASVFLGLRLMVFRVVGSGWLLVTAIGVFATLAALCLRLIVQGILGPRVYLGALGASLPSLLLGSVFLTFPLYRGLALLDRKLRPRD